MKNSKFRIRLLAATLALPAIAWLGSGTSDGQVLYDNGFETGDPGATDFYDSNTNTPGVGITVVPSGSGTLHLTAASGNNYAEITNVDDIYQPGYGSSDYTFYGAPNGIPISGAFYESTAYYIDTTWAPAGPNNNYEGFWIDTTPNNDPSSLDESNFRISVPTPGTIQVAAFDANPGTNGVVANITTSGWYTFKTTFEDSGGFVSNDMSVIDSSGNIVGSFTGVSTLPFADLAGTNYGDWTTVWQNGFANDTLGIDNVEVGVVPEPASLSLIGLGSLALLRRRRA
jgi:hypothetical protein